jgi:GGDEF domain-containing protein
MALRLETLNYREFIARQAKLLIRDIDPNGFFKNLPPTAIARIVDRGLTVNVLPDNLSFEINDSLFFPRGAFTSVVASWLDMAGWTRLVTFDFNNVHGANEAGGKPYGTYCLARGLWALLSNLPREIEAVRLGGDEVALYASKPVKDFADLFEKARGFAGTLRQFVRTGGGELLKEPMGVKEIEFRPVVKLQTETSLSPVERTERLLKFHPELEGWIKNANQSHPDFPKALAFVESLYFNPVCQSVINEIPPLSETVAYADLADVVDHFEKTKPGQYKFVYVNLPGELKYINKKHGYEAGNRRLQGHYREVLEIVAAAGLNLADLKIQVSGPDVILVLGGENLERAEILACDLEEKLNGQIVMGNIPQFAGVRVAEMTILSHDKLGEINPENEENLNRLREGLWRETLDAASDHMLGFSWEKAGDGLKEWLLDYFDPEGKRVYGRVASVLRAKGLSETGVNQVVAEMEAELSAGGEKLLFYLINKFRNPTLDN